MASIADNSTSLKVMSDANADFISLILNLRAFLSGLNPVTFTVGGEEITVNSLLKIIEDYRTGKFNELILGGQDSSTRVKLSVNANGDLSVTDMNGNLATITCGRFSVSQIDKCNCKDVTVKGATVESAEGTVNVRGGNFTFSQLKLDNLDVDSLNADSVTTSDMSVSGRVSCTDMLATGTRKFVPQIVRNVFYRNNQALDNAASLLNVSTNQQWDMSIGLTPADLGFVGLDGSASAGFVVPDLIKICGNTKYDDFRIVYHHTKLYRRVPANVNVRTTLNGSNYFGVVLDGSEYAFAAAMLWPTGVYSLASQELRLCSFALSDIGKEVYYQVLSNPWKIYRSMTLYYSSDSDRTPNAVTFENLTDLPAYTCRRFIVNSHTNVSDAGKEVVFALE